MIAKKEDEKVVVANDTLKKFIGLPIFQTDRMYDVTPPGVVTGLAWTSYGRSDSSSSQKCPSCRQCVMKLF